MDSKKLAKALRQRQVAGGLHDKLTLEQLSDEEILAAYVECSRCGGKIFANTKAAVKNAETVSEFITVVDMALAAHKCSGGGHDKRH